MKNKIALFFVIGTSIAISPILAGQDGNTSNQIQTSNNLINYQQEKLKALARGGILLSWAILGFSVIIAAKK